MAEKKKIEVFKCEEHGEVELTDKKEGDKAFCPYCGKEMKKTGEYEE